MKKFHLASLLCLLWATISCAPQEIKYIPAENSLMQIEFIYPVNWVWENRYVPDSFESLMVNDPKWITPTPPIRPDFYQEKKLIHIFVALPMAGSTIEEEMALSAKLSSVEDWPIGPVEYILNDDIMFQGLPGKHILTKREHFSVEKNEYVAEYVEYYFFRTQDRWYRLMMIIPADERNGAFGQAFDRIIETMEIRDP